MAEGRAWTLKGVSDRTRDAVQQAAQAEGLTIGEWADRVLARAANEALHPRPPAATRDDVAEVVRELLDARLAPLAERIDRATSARTGDGASPVEAVRARLRLRRAP